MEKCLSEKVAWHDKQASALEKLKPHENPPVLARQIDDECRVSYKLQAINTNKSLTSSGLSQVHR